MNVEIIRLDDLGRGICLINNKVTFVPKVVVGDIVNIKITHEHKKYNEAQLLNIVKPSPKRIDAPCKYFPFCGGCDLQNISYEDTLEYKRLRVINYFKKNNLVIDPLIIKNTHPYNYRNKITLKIKDGEVGYYYKDSHDIIKIDKCLIGRETINKVIPLINTWGIINGEVIIRCNYQEEVLIVINTKDNINIDIDLIKSTCNLKGIVLNNNPYYNDSFLYEKVNDILYRVSFDSFFQVNPYISSLMLDIINEYIEPKDNVLDYYCGVGAISLSVAKKCNSVIGVEIVPNAILSALYNARINNINNTKFLLNDCNDSAVEINYDYNKLIVDPPRKGLSKNVIDMILLTKPELVIYVSCNMVTLARDIKLLEDAYKIEKYYIMDMFSYTYHVESICVLKLIK